MFGLGSFDVLNAYSIDWLGGTRLSVIVTLVTRLVVGIGWFGMFKKAGKPAWQAFVPLLGPLQAFRIVWDDFAFASIFAGTTFVAWVVAMGVEHPLGTAMTVASVILWWVMALFTAMAFQMSMFFGLVYGIIPWAGALIFGWSPVADYQGPWSSDPDKRKPGRTSGRGRARRELDRARRKQQSGGAGKSKGAPKSEKAKESPTKDE